MTPEKEERRKALREVVDDAFKQHEKGSDQAKAIDFPSTIVRTHCSLPPKRARHSI